MNTIVTVMSVFDGIEDPRFGSAVWEYLTAVMDTAERQRRKPWAKGQDQCFMCTGVWRKVGPPVGMVVVEVEGERPEGAIPEGKAMVGAICSGCWGNTEGLARALERDFGMTDMTMAHAPPAGTQ